MVQIHGPTARLNEALKQYLRCCINNRQIDWTQLIPFAHMAYSSAKTESTMISPFVASARILCESQGFHWHCTESICGYDTKNHNETPSSQLTDQCSTILKKKTRSGIHFQRPRENTTAQTNHQKLVPQLNMPNPTDPRPLKIKLPFFLPQIPFKPTNTTRYINPETPSNQENPSHES